MITLVFLILCLILAGATYWMYRVQAATKGALLAATRKIAFDEARLTHVKQRGQAAERRCMQALANVQAAIAHADQAMEIAGQIESVGEQVRAIFDHVGAELPALDYVTAPPALTVHPGYQTTPFHKEALAS